MAISGTYLTLQQQIADELGDRQDLLAPLSDSSLATSPIQQAIQEAIAFWEREPFYFNEINDTNGFSTSPGQEFYGATTSPVSYALIATAAKIMMLHVLVGTNRYTINVRTMQYVEEISVSTLSRSQVFDVSYFAEQLRFYPIPDGAYPCTILGTNRLTTLVNPGDSNAWTQDAFSLIRCSAKLHLAQETLHDDELAARMTRSIYGDPDRPQIEGHLFRLRKETRQRRGRGRIRPSNF